MRVSRLCRLIRETFDCRSMQVPRAGQSRERTLAADDTFGRTSWDWPNGIVILQPFDKRCITPHRDGVHLFAVECPYMAMGRLAEPRCVREHGIEDWLQITG